MVQAQLTVTLPDGTWVKDVSSDHPAATIEVLSAVPAQAAGYALARIRGPAIEAFLRSMDAHRAIDERTVLHRAGNSVTVHFATGRPLLLFSAQQSGMPIELPMRIQDGVATVNVTGSRERLSELADQLERFGLTYEVTYVRDLLEHRSLLSDRQREIVQEAVDRGYYDTPRRCTLTELADGLDIAKSTCSELLHRAEGAILKEYMAEIPPETLAVAQ